MNSLLSLDFYVKRIHFIGAICVLISLVAWTSDWTGMVYACPYCRLQRTVIGILGVFMLAKGLHHWILAFIATVIGFLGAHVAAAQNFMGWKKINSGTFAFNEQLIIDPFLLSGSALFIIVGQVALILLSTRAAQNNKK